MKKISLLLLVNFSLLQSYAQKHVGINTTTPLAGLHVADSSVLFSAVGVVPLTPGNTPINGAGRRMMWYADKAAFRAGYVSGNNWDQPNTGQYSFAIGDDTKASGARSTAMGSSTVASGDLSTSAGYFTTASNTASTALGSNTTASGLAAIAMGYFSTASAQAATAICDHNTAAGINSFASGSTNIAFGNTSFAAGDNSNAVGDYSFAMGHYARAIGNRSFALGDSVRTTGYSSIAMGLGTIATGNFSTAMGDSSQADGFSSVAIGYQSETGSDNCVAMGKYARAYGSGCVAFGESCFSNGANSTAIGLLSLAINVESTALGPHAAARGKYATSIGFFSNANGLASTALGGSTASGDFSIALGGSSTASGMYSTAMGVSASTNNHSKSFCIGGASTSVANTADNQMMMRFDNYTFWVTPSNFAYLIPSSNGWAYTSDRNKKERFEELNGETVLKKIADIPFYSWNFNEASTRKYRHYGIMAQDFYAAFGKDSYGNIGNDTTVSPLDMLGVDMAAIKALEKRTQIIEQLQKENVALRQQLAALSNSMATMKKELEILAIKQPNKNEKKTITQTK